MLPTSLLLSSLWLLAAVEARQHRRQSPITDSNLGSGFGNIVVATIQPDGNFRENGFLSDTGEWAILEKDMGQFTATNNPPTADPAAAGGMITPVTITDDSGNGILGFMFNPATRKQVLTCNTTIDEDFPLQSWWVSLGIYMML